MEQLYYNIKYSCLKKIILKYKIKREKIEDLKYLQKQRERNHGLDVYSLAIGDASETAAKAAARKIDVRELKFVRNFVRKKKKMCILAPKNLKNITIF